MILFALLAVAVLASPPDSGKLQDEYVAKLTAAEPTADAQFRLAMWAKKEGLKDVAEGHLRAAVHINPNLEAAQKALGRSAKSGVWETKDEKKARLAREESLREERRDWDRRLSELGVEGACAVRSLTEAGVSAVEAFSANDAERSKSAVKAFAGSNQGAATLALLRQTLTSRFEQVRQSAARALAERNPDHVLPPLLELVRPLRGGKQIALGVGEIWYWQQGSTMFVALPAPTRLTPLARPDQAAGEVPVRFSTQRRPEAATLHEGEANALEEQQSQTEFVRTNAVAALQTITGKKIGADFSGWRDALLQVHDLSIDSRQAAPQTVSATYYQSDKMTVGLIGSGVPPDCLAAGTLVAAKRGLIPIEKICVGELVLSRNMETGETAYKPILSRSLRQRTPVRAISIGEETIHATVGHSFWTEGDGWRKAKDLSLGTTLGAEKTRATLTTLGEVEEPAQAYNLVVADFGTYFVGKSRVLVHDNSPIRNAPAKIEK